MNGRHYVAEKCVLKVRNPFRKNDFSLLSLGQINLVFLKITLRPDLFRKPFIIFTLTTKDKQL